MNILASDFDVDDPKKMLSIWVAASNQAHFGGAKMFAPASRIQGRYTLRLRR